MDLTTQILATVEGNRLEKAVSGLGSGAYAVTVTRQGEAEMRGLVKNGDGKEYGVTLLEGAATCSCPDALYRGVVFKHAVALALHALRTPPEPTPPDFHLDAPVRRNGHVGTVVCVSGDLVSVGWDGGRITPHTRGELEAA
jgi:hypothetical protein